MKTFPGPRGLPDTGDRDWWLPAIALMADGVPRDKIFPMDLDRAYKKLDEIKPYISVWWKTGNQVAQIMRDQEVAMTLSYSGRALTAMNEGAPFQLSWNDAIMDTGYFAILKDAPNPEGALEIHQLFLRSRRRAPGLHQDCKLCDPFQGWYGVASAGRTEELCDGA
ncbi:hypothetical protein BFS10_15240 [Brucella suis]|nr:hypothetical protein BFS10_15240 [Brucella suis]